MLNATSDDVCGRDLLDKDDGRLRAAMGAARKGGEGICRGPLFAEGFSSCRVRIGALESGSLLLSLEDRAEVDIATDAFHASERRFDLLVDASTDGVIVHQAGVIVYANPAARRLLGGSDVAGVVGRGLSEFVDDTSVDAFKRWMRELRSNPGEPREHCVRRSDGRALQAQAVMLEGPVDDGPAQFLFLRDVTERRRLEAELERSHRFAALGSLAGSVAHDFNNLLAGIQGSLSLAERHIASPDDAKRALDTARAAVEQATSLTRELLAFGRGERPEAVRVRVTDVIREVAELFRNMDGVEVGLSVAIADETIAAWAARSQLHQVLLNVLVNGRDAVGNGGKIHISLSHSGPEREWVKLSVIDDGPGMDAATRSRIFEPFFTTKGPGSGTGLGLSTANSIIKQLGGWIEVESELGKGAAFHVFLQSAEKAAAAPPRAVEHERSAPPASGPVSAPPADPRRDAERILGDVVVCEDDARLCLLTAGLLESSGYRVSTHGDAAALLRAELHGEEVVLLDLHLGSDDILPVLDALAARKRSPSVVITSGTSPEDVPVAVRTHRLVVDFLAKPYRVERLTACLLSAMVTSRPDSAASASPASREEPGEGEQEKTERSAISGTRPAYNTEVRERPRRTGGHNGNGNGRGNS